MRSQRQVLVFDADDTLWENNVLFERAFAGFVDWLAHPVLGAVDIRHVMIEVQRETVPTHGYGSASFLHSLGVVAERLRERAVSEPERREIAELAADVTSHRIELVPGVADTLTELGSRHDLLLLTKGDRAEQRRKLDASELAHHFRDVHIVAEKDVDVYRRLARQHELAPESSWMIGNSPKSDIVPARQAGFGAVFIPNPYTWELEHAEFQADKRVLELGKLAELVEHF